MNDPGQCTQLQIIDNSKSETEFTTEIDQIPVGEFKVTVSCASHQLESSKSNAVLLKIDEKGETKHHVIYIYNIK